MEKTIEFMRMFLDKEHSDFEDEHIELFNKALTNKGSDNNPYNNQRLAFLGDVVLELIIKDHIFTKNPDWKKVSFQIVKLKDTTLSLNRTNSMHHSLWI